MLIVNVVKGSIINFTLDGVNGSVIVSLVNGKFSYSDLPVPVTPPAPGPVPVPANYRDLENNCGTGTATPITNGVSFYKFTVPKGVYNAVFVAYQQAKSYVWSEQVVIKKDGNVTADDYVALMAQFKTPTPPHNLRSTGENNLWYGLTPAGDSMGSTIAIKNSPDGVISTINGKTTFARDVTFTMLLSAGDVGPNKVPAQATHKLRWCAV